MRIGLFTHSTNPRGGVVHALELAEAFHTLGHHATVVAPCPPGRAMFRQGAAPVILVPSSESGSLVEQVRLRIDDVVRFFTARDAPSFDIWHAQDTITANALADLAASGRIRDFTRTVHHLDRFEDARLAAWQRRGVAAASRVLCVGAHVAAAIAAEFGIEAALVGNGVDLARFDPNPTRADAPLARRLGLDGARGPVHVVFGGIEARKNSVAVLHAFLAIHAEDPDGRLVVAGGASLLDHGATRREFHRVLADSGASDAVIRAGILADEEVPALYRLADAVLQVSRAEGFGLCPLEAMACGTPTVVSDAAPFTAHFARDECLFADPGDIAAIGRAMRAVVQPSHAARLALSGPRTATRFTWDAVARRHLGAYAGRPRRTSECSDGDARCLTTFQAPPTSSSSVPARPGFR